MGVGGAHCTALQCIPLTNPQSQLSTVARLGRSQEKEEELEERRHLECVSIKKEDEKGKNVGIFYCKSKM